MQAIAAFVRTLFYGACLFAGVAAGVYGVGRYRVDAKIDDLIEVRNGLLQSLSDCRKKNCWEGDEEESPHAAAAPVSGG